MLLKRCHGNLRPWCGGYGVLSLKRGEQNERENEDREKKRNNERERGEKV